jgi:hypothetical protein
MIAKKRHNQRLTSIRVLASLLLRDLDGDGRSEIIVALAD